MGDHLGKGLPPHSSALSSFTPLLDRWGNMNGRQKQTHTFISPTLLHYNLSFNSHKPFPPPVLIHYIPGARGSLGQPGLVLRSQRLFQER